MRPRITTAYAGKTSETINQIWRNGDHPRLRGKDLSIRFSSLNHSGSPPLTRERPQSAQALASLARITPAYAGKTRKIRRDLRRERDHPRLRGKDISNSTIHKERGGSPPLTRERLSTIQYNKHRARITPAYAGKTLYQNYILLED